MALFRASLSMLRLKFWRCGTDSPKNPLVDRGGVQKTEQKILRAVCRAEHAHSDGAMYSRVTAGTLNTRDHPLAALRILTGP